MKWYKRLQFQFTVDYSMFPGNMKFKEWLFDPHFLYIVPGQEIKTLNHVPDGKASAFLIDDGDILHSRYLWLCSAIRLVGLDIGFGVFYLANPKE